MAIEPTSLAGRWAVFPSASPSGGAFVDVPAAPTSAPTRVTLFRRPKEPLGLNVIDWAWDDDAGRGSFSIDDGRNPEAAWLVPTGTDRLAGGLKHGRGLLQAVRITAPPAELEGAWSVQAVGGAPLQVTNAWTLKAQTEEGFGQLTLARRFKSVVFRIVALPSPDDGYRLLALDPKGSVLQLQVWKVGGGAFLVTEDDNKLTYLLYRGEPPAGWPSPTDDDTDAPEVEASPPTDDFEEDDAFDEAEFEDSEGAYPARDEDEDQDQEDEDEDEDAS